LTEATDNYEDMMKKTKAKIKTMTEGLEDKIEELNQDNDDFKE